MEMEIGYKSRTTQPYINVGLIVTTWTDGTRSIGTYSLVGRNDILTAGHCVFNPDHGGVATGYELYFGADYNSLTGQYEDIIHTPRFTKWMVSSWIPEIYTDADNSSLTRSESQYDVALIGIDNPIGDDFGWLSLAADYNEDQTAFAVGYPAFSSGMMREAVSVTSSLAYGIYESSSGVLGPGSSGGPLLIGNSVIGVKSTSLWWADIGNEFVFPALIDALAKNDQLLEPGNSDHAAPTVAKLLPADKASDVSLAADIIVVFSEPIQRGKGSIRLKTANDQVLADYDVAKSSNLSISGNILVIDPDVDFKKGTSYTVQFSAESIEDLAGNDYNSHADYTFATASIQGLTVMGHATPEKIFGTAGDDTINGNEGIDTVVFSGQLADYTISETDGYHIVKDNTGNDGTDLLTNVERLQFEDAKIALDVSGNPNAGFDQTGYANAGQIYRLYQGAFDRAPDKAGLAYWLNQADSGFGLTKIALEFVRSDEFMNRYGKLSNQQFIDQLYQNILHRSGESDGVAYWHSQLDSNTQTREQVLVGFSESGENQAALIGTIQVGIDYTV